MSEHEDCRKCKSWKGCIGKDWYHYGEIRWCPLQCIWILQYAQELKEGRWPEISDFSSEEMKTEAPFARTIAIIAELEERLDMTDNKGELLITQVEDGRTFDDLSQGARAILLYVKGWRRKSIGFRRWLREVYYQKTGEKRQLAGVS